MTISHTIPRKKIWFEARDQWIYCKKWGDSTGIPGRTAASTFRAQNGQLLTSLGVEVGLGAQNALSSGENDDEPWDLLKHRKKSKQT